MTLHRIAALILLVMVVPRGAASGQSSSSLLFRGNMSARTAKRTARHFRISIRRWEIDAEEGGSQTIPLPAFSVVTLCSGRIETTINGQTVVRTPEEFWTVKPGVAMKVRVLSESAILQAVIVSP